MRSLAAETRLEALGVEAISEAADVARATFFLHFASKMALREALEAQLTEELRDILEAGEGRAEDRLREASERLLEWGALAGDLLQSALSLRGASPCPLLQVLEGFVKTRQRAGELRRSLPPESAARLTAGVLGAMLVDGRTGDPGARADRCEASLALLMNGMREPKPRLKWSAPG